MFGTLRGNTLPASSPAGGDGDAQDRLANGVPTLADLIAPDGVQVGTSHVHLGSRWVTTYVVAALPALVAFGFLSALYEIGDVEVSMHLHPADDREVVNELSSLLVKTESDMILSRRRGDSRNHAVHEETRQTLEELRRAVQCNETRIFYVTICFAVAADTLEELERRRRLVEQRLAGRMVRVVRAFLRQADGLKSVLPMGTNLLADVYQNFDLGSAAALFPWGGADIVHDGGVFLGFNLSTAAPIIFNAHVGPPVLANPHLGVFGVAGSGKSFFLKTLAARSAVLGVRTAFLDPDGEYGALVRRAGGVYVRLSPEGPVAVNPFDLEAEDDEAGDGRVNLLEKLGDIKALIAVMVEGMGERLSGEERSMVETVAREEYAARGITDAAGSLKEPYSEFAAATYSVGTRRKEMPTLSSFRDRLRSRGAPAERLCRLLESYLRGGSLGLFDGQSSVDLGDAPLVGFDLSALEERFARPLAMHVVLGWIWEKFVKRNPRILKRVVVDEGWMFMKHSDTAVFLENMARRARKRRCSLCVASQSFREFAEDPLGRAVLTNLDTLMLMQQSSKDVDEVARAFQLSQGQREFLLAVGIGEGLLRAGRQVAGVRVVASESEWQFVTT